MSSFLCVYRSRGIFSMPNSFLNRPPNNFGLLMTTTRICTASVNDFHRRPHRGSMPLPAARPSILTEESHTRAGQFQTLQKPNHLNHFAVYHGFCIAYNQPPVNVIACVYYQTMHVVDMRCQSFERNIRSMPSVKVISHGAVSATLLTHNGSAGCKS